MNSKKPSLRVSHSFSSALTFGLLVSLISLVLPLFGITAVNASTPTPPFTITYDYNGATANATPATDTYDPGTPPYDTPITLPVPVKTGFAFAGWFEDPSFTIQAVDSPTGYIPSDNVTLTAKWDCDSAEIATPIKSATWSKNPTPVSETATLTVSITDGATPVSGVAGCLQVDSNSKISTASAFSEASPGIYESSITFNSFSGASVLTGDVKVLYGSAVNAFVTASSVRLDAGALDIGSIDVGISGVKKTVVTKTITVKNLDANSVTLSAEPALSGVQKTDIALTSATATGTYITFITGSANPYYQGQLVTITGFTNTDLNVVNTPIVFTDTNSFTVAKTAPAAQETTAAQASSENLYIDNSSTCQTSAPVASQATCTVVLKWGISVQAATTATTIGTLSLSADGALPAQTFVIKGTAQEGAPVIQTISGPLERQVQDVDSQWCATGVSSAGAYNPGSTSCSSGTWSNSYSAFSVDPAQKYYSILNRFYGNNDHPYGPITGSNHWISCDIYLDSLCANQKIVIFRIRFNIPDKGYDPAFTFTFQGDNYVEAWVNPPTTSNIPVLIQGQSASGYFTPGGSVSDSPGAATMCSTNWQDYSNNGSTGINNSGSNTPPGNLFAQGGSCTSSTGHLVPGTNYIYVRLGDDGGLAGINYRLDLGYKDSTKSCLSCGSGGGPGPVNVALIPTFDSTTYQAPGYTFHISNYDAENYVWSVSSPAVLDGATGIVTVSSLVPVTVTTEREEYPSGSATTTPPSPPPLLDNPIKNFTLTSANSAYSKNTSSGYVETVTVGIVQTAGTYSSGSYVYSVLGKDLHITQATTGASTTSITLTATEDSSGLAVGQLITAFGLGNLSIQNWQISSITGSAPVTIVAVAPTGATANILTGIFTASITASQSVTKAGNAAARGNSANCAVSPISATQIKLYAVALPGQTTPGAGLVPVTNNCKVVVSHDADNTYAASTSQSDFNFVKQQPVGTYTGTLTMVEGGKANLNSTWDTFNGCTVVITPSQFRYTVSGTSTYQTPRSPNSLQSVLISLPSGGYEITPEYGGDYNCLSSNSQTLSTGFAVYSASSSAYGGGSYTNNGRANFGFEIHKMKDNSQKGNFVWNWKGQWRFKGTLSKYGRMTSGKIGTQSCSTTNVCGSLTGIGQLDFFNTATATWQSVGNAISVNVSAISTTSTSKFSSPGYIAVAFGYSAVAGQPALPSNGLITLSKSNSNGGGMITLN